MRDLKITEYQLPTTPNLEQAVSPEGRYRLLKGGNPEPTAREQADRGRGRRRSSNLPFNPLRTLRDQMPARPLVAIVEDDERVRDGIRSLLRSAGIPSTMFGTAEELLAADPASFVCVISDVQLPGMSGLQLQERMRDVAPGTALILLSGYPDQKVRSRAMAAGARLFLEKPSDPALLVSAVQKLFGRGKA